MMEEGEEEAPSTLEDDKKPLRKPRIEKKKVETGKEFTSLTLEELTSKMKQAINDEAYELASLLRDEINRRKKEDK